MTVGMVFQLQLYIGVTGQLFHRRYVIFLRCFLYLLNCEKSENRNVKMKLFGKWQGGLIVKNFKYSLAVVLMINSIVLLTSCTSNNDVAVNSVVSENQNVTSNTVKPNVSDEYSEVTEENLILEESNQFEEVGSGSDGSRKKLMNYLPELYNKLSSDDGIVMGNARFDENTFSICDIDSDGEAELLVKITTGTMAANGLYIYKADSSGQVVQEGTMSNNSDFYKNGYVKSPWSHNQGLGTLWPYTVMQYIKAEDEYTNIYSLDSWDKSVNPESFNGESFPDNIDISSTGTIYYINNFVSGEEKTCDYFDYVKWFNSWNQCSPKLRINYEAYSEDNIKKYNPDSNIAKESETPVNNSDARPALDVDDSVTASYNSDGSIKIEYNNVPMSMTLPASWVGKFVVRNGSFFARTAYYNEYGGKLLPIILRDEYDDSNGFGRYIGKAGYKYCFYYRVTDVNYDMDNSAETSEYESLRAGIETVLQSAVCTPYEDKISVDIISFSRPYPTGQISSGGKTIEGYTSDYVCHGAEQSVQWRCEDTWHITAARKVYSYGVEWYECWDTDDGDYYGWIDSKYLHFYSAGSSSNQSSNTSSVSNLDPYVKGQISSNGKEIEGYTTDYVCNGGTKTAQWTCEDTWHITARRKTYSYGIWWYECWDTDDGDYYGWIDSNFLYFY